MKTAGFSKPLIFINGKLVSNETILAPFLGENQINIFETIGMHQGKIFFLEEHLKRLFESAKTIGLELPKSESEIKKEIEQVASNVGAEEQLFLRPTVFHDHMFILVFKRVHNPEIYKKGVHLKTSAVKRNLSEAFRPEAKTGQFLNGILASLDPQAQDSFETLFLDRNGYVKETRVWNIFIVRKGLVQTPESAGILDGVTRRFVIKCARKEGLEVSETRLTRHDIWSAQEAFLTNTSGMVLPIRSLDGRLIGEQIPGNVTEKLAKRFEMERSSSLKEIYG